MTSQASQLERSAERGQGMVEYALVLFLVTCVVVLSVHRLGTAAASDYTKINDALACGSSICPVQMAGLVELYPPSAPPNQVTANLPNPTKSGDMLIAVVSDHNNHPIIAPPGWQLGGTVNQPGNGIVDIFYRVNVPAGISTVTFTTTNETVNMGAELSEWSGGMTTAPVDRTGVRVTAAGSTSLTVATAGATSINRELGIACWSGSGGNTSIASPRTGWRLVFSDVRSDWQCEYQNSLPPKVASDTFSYSPASAKAFGVMVTFKPL